MRSNLTSILFLCTGNYYRSRFAEILFNHQAASRNLPVRAFSRAIALELGVNNVGPISQQALAGLRQRQVPPPQPLRFPAQLLPEDLSSAWRVIALDRTEHHPLLLSRFPAWADRVEYWSIPDLHLLAPAEALQGIAEGVQALIGEMEASPDFSRRQI